MFNHSCAPPHLLTSRPEAVLSKKAIGAARMASAWRKEGKCGTEMRMEMCGKAHGIVIVSREKHGQGIAGWKASALIDHRIKGQSICPKLAQHLPKPA